VCLIDIIHLLDGSYSLKLCYNVLCFFRCN